MSEARLAALRAPLAPIEADAWVVGGSLRDALLGRPVADLDVAVAGDAEAAARALARHHGAGRFRLSRDFGAWRVHGGALPFTVDLTPLQGGSLGADLARRDLTVNAMALAAGPGAPEVVDPHGGRGDLAARRLRPVGPTSLADDPVRVVRMARLAAQLGFVADPGAVALARAAAPRLPRVPPERVMEELRRIAALATPAAALAGLDALGGLGALVPELEQARGMDQSAYHHKDVLGHTLEVVEHCAGIAADPEPVFMAGSAPRIRERLAEPLADGLTRGQALVFTALMHDMAKPATRAVTPEGRVTFWHHDRLGAGMADAWCRAMHTSGRLREAVARGVRHHLDLGFMVHRQPLSLARMDRFLRSVAPDEVEALVLSAADRLATDGPRTTPDQIRRHLVLAREVMRAHWALVDRGPVRPPLDGAALVRLLGRPPGPWLQDLLDATREAQLMGRVTTPAQAERFARAWEARRASVA
ncbi:MAG: HD domain-containing protein [Thermoleophilia bacterium]|nr:HD domain-containing protein [Thermoleophilia bacterium]